ncbi:ABC transporter ATP-binding protein, partial [Amycolatopsis sp. H6(2020)]|nr:ABC transporter ATP-binding protein [Amycolatopsis sp. H6(2020)]
SGADSSGAGSAGAESSGAAVSLEGVGFSYPDEAGAEAPVLRGVDLRLRPGETVALVGATGSGKSTLLMLLPRLYEADAGRILLDGRDAAELSLDELRGQIAVAFEEPTLFSASVRQNVLMGVPDVVGPDGRPVPDELLDADQTARREQILSTALRAAAAEFAWELPDGVDTQIGEEGLSLSGGQRQRLALARAIAADPRLMLLDDPLSALDTRTEAAVVDNLRRVLTGTTTLLTAHRPSTVALADRVALLRDGRIAAVGTHRELLALPEYRYVMSAEEATRG